nr:DUF2723 domain-containing protein [Anaerolineae bacterium]
MPPSIDRFTGCILGQAVGDALGFRRDHRGHQRRVQRYRGCAGEPGPRRHRPGQPRLRRTPRLGRAPVGAQTSCATHETPMTKPRIRNPQSAISSLLIVSLFIGSLFIYTATLLPDILPADSGEFQLVAATAGVAHPPGYPLYTMLGWLFAHLAVGPNPAWRVNLFSAVTAAATVALVFHTARRMTGSAWGGLAAALTLGSATTFWATATTASIRPLVAFFTALCLHALITHRASRITQHASRIMQHATNSQPSNERYLALFALSLSLGLTHHLSLLFPASVFIIYLTLVDPALLRQPRRWLKPIGAFALGLLVLVYLPLRGAASAPLAPPDLATLPGFLEHVLARGFRGDMFALNLFDRLVLLPTLLRFQFNPVLLLTALLGALLLLWRDRRLALLLVGSFLVHTAATLTYRAPQTVEYEMPAYVSLALLVAILCGAISNLQICKSASKPASLRVCKSAILVIFLAAGLVNLTAHLPSYGALSQSHDARIYAETLLRDAPADAVILSNWHWATPMWYLQRVEGLRPDVTVRYVAPRGEPLAQTWVSMIEEHVPQQPVIVVRYFEHEYNDLPYRFEPLGEAFLVRTTPRFTPPPGLTPLDVTLGEFSVQNGMWSRLSSLSERQTGKSAPLLHQELGEQVVLLGYRLETDGAEPSHPLVLTLAWSPAVTPMADLALFAQLLGPDGRLWSGAQDRLHPADRLVAGEVVIERFVVYPLLHAPPGDYVLIVGAYLPAEPGAPRLTTADGADAVRLTTVRLRPSTLRPVTRHPTFVRFAGGPTLIGANYDTGVPGQVRVYLHWAGPGVEATLRLLDASGVVLGQGRVPTLERGQYTTTALDLSTAPTQVVLLDGDHPRRWNLLFSGAAPLPSPSPGERYVPFGDALVLVRFDGPTGDLEPGADITLGLHFLGVRPLERDYVVSTALTSLNPDGTWAWRDPHDSVPALGAIPTLKWIRGSAVFDPHQLTVPSDASPVPVVGSLVIYDHFTQTPLSPLDERLGPVVPLGTWPVASP